MDAHGRDTYLPTPRQPVRRRLQGAGVPLRRCTTPHLIPNSETAPHWLWGSATTSGLQSGRTRPDVDHLDPLFESPGVRKQSEERSLQPHQRTCR